MGNVPEQVRRQAERAEELLNQANGVPATPEDEIPAEPETPEPEVGETTPPPQDPPASEQPPQDPPADTVDWEHKYKSLQGVFNAERRTWQAEKAQLEARVQASETQHQAPPPQPEAPKSPQRKLTDQDIETYGPELVEVIQRAAADIADDIVAQRMQELQPELDKTRKQVTEVAGTVYQSAQERFFGELEKAVPDWQQINTDPRWLSWLGEVDQLSGVPRQVYLDNASHKMDYGRTAALFNAFKEAAGLTKPAEPTPAPAAPAKPKLSPQPRTVGNAVAPTPREPDTQVSRAEIDAHYRRSSMDVGYRNSTDHKAMEERIALAMATGNIA